MTLNRREILAGTGAAIATGTIAPADSTGGPPAWPNGVGWDEVRAQFSLSPDWIDMSAMLLASHPRPVAEAIERHRRALDANPIVYLENRNRPLQEAAREAAGRYLGGVPADAIALTDSTTMGVALVYHGLRLRPGQEVLTTEQDFYVTHESLRLAASRCGASVRRISLYESHDLPDAITGDAIVERILREIRPETRAIALTWVHSSTGLKIPVRGVARGLARINGGRDENDQVLLCVDGVHGFGNQAATFAELGCDFLIAGCHKWLFGPRGTGIVAGTARGWRAVAPTIPSFLDGPSFGRWMRRQHSSPTATTGAAFTPGGFKAFEHQWALSDAFQWHAELDKARVAARTAELAVHLKEGLAGMANVALRTPRSIDLSAGIVSFDVGGRSPEQVVGWLREKRIIASVAPYATPHARLTPSIRNTQAEVETALRAIHTLARS
jgi:isopenicillin-N epimerase